MSFSPIFDDLFHFVFLIKAKAVYPTGEGDLASPVPSGEGLLCRHGLHEVVVDVENASFGNAVGAGADHVELVSVVEPDGWVRPGLSVSPSRGGGCWPLSR